MLKNYRFKHTCSDDNVTSHLENSKNY